MMPWTPAVFSAFARKLSVRRPGAFNPVISSSFSGSIPRGSGAHSAQPTVTKLAEDRAEQLKRNPDLMRSNKASAGEKSIRHGHPSTLHLWVGEPTVGSGFVSVTVWST